MPAAPSGQKIRVLVVDDIAETRENIRKLLQFESDIEVVGAAKTGKEGIALAQEGKPNVILMDINMPDMDGIAATEAIVKAVPAAQIVILSVQSDPDYMRRAMLAGARDFLTKPPSGEELIRTIRKVNEMSLARLAAMPPAAAMMPPGARGMPYAMPFKPEGKVVAVYSAKGGVGCTTLITNLAVALHSEERRVLLVDGNLQFGDVGVFLNLQSNRTILDLVGLDEVDPDVLESALVPHNSGVKVILAPPRPEMAEEVTGAHVKTLLQQLRREFPLVLVDTASGLTDVVLSVFDVADRILLVTTPDIPAIKDARLFFELMDALEYPDEKILFVMNKVDRRGGIQAANVEELIKHPVGGQVSADERSVLHAINQGVPLVMGDRAKAPVPGILELAGRLKRELAEAEAALAGPLPKDDRKAAARPRRPGL